MTSDSGNAVIRATKTRLRKAVRLRISQLSATERERADAIICEGLLSLAIELDAAFAVAYLALPDEARVDGFLAAMVERSRRVFLPRVTTDGEIALGPWRPGTRLQPDFEGVPAPPGDGSWPAGQGLLVVPGRVFDTEGGRIGRGLGYYDRFLAAAGHRAVVVGAAYECQVEQAVPREPHDVGMQVLVTETGRRRFDAA